MMENFALVPEVLNASKRIKLLVMALKYNSPNQAESTYRVRFEAWYELMYLLGKNIKHHALDVVKEFLIFCYGPKSKPEAKTGSPSHTSLLSTPTKPMSPVKKFSGLERY